jgi:hypothetical protein
VRLAGVGVHLQRTVYVAAARSHIQALRDGQLRRWGQVGPKFGALTPFAPGDLRSAAMGCALMGAWTCALGRLNSGPSRLERPFVDKPVPGAPSHLARRSRSCIRPDACRLLRSVAGVACSRSRPPHTEASGRPGSQNGSRLLPYQVDPFRARCLLIAADVSSESINVCGTVPEVNRRQESACASRCGWAPAAVQERQLGAATSDGRVQG